MDLGTLLGVVIGALSFCGTVAGAIYAYGKMSERVKDNTGDIADLRKRVEKAEDAASQVSGLAQSIEHLTDKVGDSLKHIGDSFALEMGHMRAQMGDLRDELKHVRNNASMALQGSARRRSPPPE